jgi:hypothetical protein
MSTNHAASAHAEFRRPSLAMRGLFALAALVANVVLLGGGLALFEMQAERGAQQLANARAPAASTLVARMAHSGRPG